MTTNETILTARPLDSTADLAQILDRAREISREVVAAEAERTDQEGLWPESSVRALLGSGLGGLVVPRRDGGLGHGLLALTQSCEIVGYECASTALCFGMHCVGSAVIAAKATEYQRDSFLRPIAEGRHLTTLALSEPGSGVHFFLPETELAPAGPDSYLVSGTKSFVTNGAHADSYVISTVAASSDAPPGQFSCAVVRRDTSGLEWGPEWKGMGMRGNASRPLTLRSSPVPRKDLLGEEGDQIWYVFHVVAPYFLAAMAGTYLGLAARALAEARKHLMERRHAHSGETLAQSPILQHRFGAMWAQVERTRRLSYFAAAEAESGGPDALAALCSAKAEVGDCVVSVVNEVLTMVGGLGYQRGGTLERLMRDARAAPVMAPTTDLLRLWTGRAVLGMPLLGE